MAQAVPLANAHLTLCFAKVDAAIDRQGELLGPWRDFSGPVGW
jgi:hypothetical protein